MNIKCPHCSGEAIIEGKVYNQIDYINPPAYFRPKSAFYAIFGNNVGFENVFSACSACGFMWAKIDTQKLQQFIPGQTKVYELET